VSSPAGSDEISCDRARTSAPDLLNIGLWPESPQVGTSFSVG
jgi:hypothetical protein